MNNSTNKQVNGSTQLRHNFRTMNACAIDKDKLNEVLHPVLADMMYGLVEGLRDAYIDLGCSCISRNPTFVLINHDHDLVMTVNADHKGRPTNLIGKATEFSVSEQDSIMNQVNTDVWKPVSRGQAAELLLQSYTDKIHDYIDSLIEVGMTPLTDIKQIQSRAYFGYEFPIKELA